MRLRPSRLLCFFGRHVRSSFSLYCERGCGTNLARTATEVELVRESLAREARRYPRLTLAEWSTLCSRCESGAHTEPGEGLWLCLCSDRRCPCYGARLRLRSSGESERDARVRDMEERVRREERRRGLRG